MELKCEYKFYYSSGIDHRKNMTKEDFEFHLKQIGTFKTYTDFWNIFLHLKLPTNLHLKSKIFLFKKNILPIWEREENADGGRIYIKIPNNQEANVIWQNVVLEFLCGFSNIDFYNNMINGIELSMRHSDEITLAIWTNIRVYRTIKDFFYELKNSANLPKYIEFDFGEHPIKFFQKNKEKKYHNNNK